MNALVRNVNIRGHEEKTNKNGGKYLLVHFEDETGAPQELVDKDMDRAKFYTRDTEGDLTISITTGKWTNIRIEDFKVKEK